MNNPAKAFGRIAFGFFAALLVFTILRIRNMSNPTTPADPADTTPETAVYTLKTDTFNTLHDIKRIEKVQIARALEVILGKDGIIEKMTNTKVTVMPRSSKVSPYRHKTFLIEDRELLLDFIKAIKETEGVKRPERLREDKIWNDTYYTYESLSYDGIWLSSEPIDHLEEVSID